MVKSVFCLKCYVITKDEKCSNCKNKSIYINKYFESNDWSKQFKEKFLVLETTNEDGHCNGMCFTYNYLTLNNILFFQKKDIKTMGKVIHNYYNKEAKKRLFEKISKELAKEDVLPEMNDKAKNAFKNVKYSLSKECYDNYLMSIIYSCDINIENVFVIMKHILNQDKISNIVFDISLESDSSSNHAISFSIGSKNQGGKKFNSYFDPNYGILKFEDVKKLKHIFYMLFICLKRDDYKRQVRLDVITYRDDDDKIKSGIKDICLKECQEHYDDLQNLFDDCKSELSYEEDKTSNPQYFYTSTKEKSCKKEYTSFKKLDEDYENVYSSDEEGEKKFEYRKKTPPRLIFEWDFSRD
jgi:hypothetical protein